MSRNFPKQIDYFQKYRRLFLLGRYIVEQEQQGQERAKYGSKGIDSLSSYLTEEYGRAKQPFKLSWTHYQILMRIEDKDDVL